MLVLQDLIEVSDEKLKRRKKTKDQCVETYIMPCHKSTITEKKYLYEGDEDIAKRSENMLTVDGFLEGEFSKTVEIFDVFVS